MRPLWYLLVLAPQALLSNAQTPAALEFDVASIRLNVRGGTRSGMDNAPGLWKALNVPVRFLIMQAYELLPDQISGAPAWVDADRYDIDAKYEPDPALTGSANWERTRARIRSLLASRFQLEAHRQTKDWQVYAMVAGKRGPKVTASTKERSSLLTNNGHLEANGATMEGFARNLAGLLGRPVVDQTGLEGRFDFTLDYEPEVQLHLADDKPVASGSEASRPSLFTALQDQLGLKLESKKAPVEVLVIDRIARPSEN